MEAGGHANVPIKPSYLTSPPPPARRVTGAASAARHSTATRARRRHAAGTAWEPGAPPREVKGRRLLIYARPAHSWAAAPAGARLEHETRRQRMAPPPRLGPAPRCTATSNRIGPRGPFLSPGFSLGSFNQRIYLGRPNSAGQNDILGIVGSVSPCGQSGVGRGRLGLWAEGLVVGGGGECCVTPTVSRRRSAGSTRRRHRRQPLTGASGYQRCHRVCVFVLRYGVTCLSPDGVQGE
ncbi:unnamed protein product [Arctogadus glacialis]